MDGQRIKQDLRQSMAADAVLTPQQQQLFEGF